MCAYTHHGHTHVCALSWFSVFNYKSWNSFLCCTCCRLSCVCSVLLLEWNEGKTGLGVQRSTTFFPSVSEKVQTQNSSQDTLHHTSLARISSDSPQSVRTDKPLPDSEKSANYTNKEAGISQVVTSNWSAPWIWGVGSSGFQSKEGSGMPRQKAKQQ